MTLYAFSTENWKRPKREINFLFNLLENFLIQNINKLQNQKIKIKIIGEKKFNKKLNKVLLDSEIKTKNNKKLQINLALNYGSKKELINTLKLIKKNKENISEKNVKKYLFTSDSPDPDLLIRTGNTNRLSNFVMATGLFWDLFRKETVARF